MLSVIELVGLDSLLFYILLSPLLGVSIILITPSKDKLLLKKLALNFSFLPFLLSLILLLLFDKTVGTFQYVTRVLWLPSLNLNFILGIDGISLLFLLLSTFLITLCVLSSWNSASLRLKEFLIFFLLLDFFLIGTFCSLNVTLFYIFFESVLLPMFLIIGIWGSRERKTLAAYYFFFYTFVGSILMLLSLTYVHSVVGTTDYETLLTFSFSLIEQKFLWFAFFIALAGKVPMVPFHLWLPEAHVEAPTSGSVILAGILLKLGVYGLVRFSLPLFPKACFFFAPLVYTLAIMGIIYTSFTAIRQTDLKRVVAYTSIAHMNLVVLGLFSFTVLGIEGAIIQSLSHGFVASGLFLIIGVLYDRYKTRIVQYYGGLASVMPLFVSTFLFFILSNISFPGTSGFVGEFLILLGSFKVNNSITFLAAISTIIGAVYSLWLFNRISFGNLKSQYTVCFIDLSLREFFLFLPLILGTIVIGLYPNILLSYLHMSVNNLVEFIYF